MKIIKGKFTRLGWDDEEAPPAAGAILELRLSQDAKSPDGLLKGLVPLYEITLDEHGAIPPQTRILANDELEPNTACYIVTLIDDDSSARDHCELLRIEGDSPIDLNELTPLEKAPCYVEPPSDPEPPRPPRPTREPGTSTNYNGFFGVSVHLPVRTGSTSLPSLDSFGICGFHLPSDAVVACASILVDSAERGKECLLGLYDGDGKRVLATRISVERSGVAIGYFDSPVHLSAGDYRLAWAMDRLSHATLRSIDVNLDLFAFGIGAGVSQARGRELPENLGDVTGKTCVPPVVFFQA
jgi:hypothetical protein